MRWMNLEPTVQGEVSQKEKDKYCISGWVTGKEPACQCRRNKRWGFDPWVGKFPWRTAWQATPVSLPGVLHGQEPGRLQSAGSQRVRHDWSDLVAAAATRVWTRERWYWWIYLQGRGSSGDRQTTDLCTVWEGDGRMNWEGSVEAYTLLHVK